MTELEKQVRSTLERPTGRIALDRSDGRIELHRTSSRMRLHRTCSRMALELYTKPAFTRHFTTEVANQT